MKNKTKNWIRILCLVLFLIYVAALVYVLFLAESYGRTGGSGELRYNFVPFREIRRFVSNVDVLGVRPVLLNVGGNIAIFVPFGMFYPALRRNMRSVWKMTLLSCLFSVCIEATQLFTRVGACDIDDVILNTVGGMIGAVIFALADYRRNRSADSKRRKNG